MVRTSGEVWLHAHQVWRTSDIGITSSKAVKGGGAHESRSVARPNAPHKCACGSMCHLFTSTAILELTQAPIEPIHTRKISNMVIYARERRARRAVARLHDRSEVSFRAGQGGSRAWEGALGRAWALRASPCDGASNVPRVTCRRAAPVEREDGARVAPLPDCTMEAR